MTADRTHLVRMLPTDRSLSLGELANATQIDEATVAALLQQLDRDGLPLHKESDARYRLLEPVLPIDVSDLVEQLEKASFAFARQTVVLDTVDSTSDWLSREQKAGRDIHGKACITEFQSAGRGRRGRSWQGSPYCHLMLSIGWRFQKEAAEMTGLSLSIGVAVADCLKELTGVPVGLKWPNDLWYRDQKLGGILVDLNTSSRGATVAVVGIGINLHEPGSNQFDPGQPVTDLFSNAEDDLPPRTTIIAHVLGAIANVLDRFHQHQFAPDQDRFNALDVFAGRKVRAESKGKLREGIGKGADELGRYCVHCANGVVETINSGDISLSLAD